MHACSYVANFIIAYLTILCIDFPIARRGFLSTATVVLVIFSCINLALEGLQALNRKLNYFSEWRNYVEIGLSSLTISFVFSVRFNDCFCPNASQWQLGCVAIFLAWIDLILLMNTIPFVATSINMLISIMNSFLKLVFLPVLLIISFGIPLFLLFHEPVNCVQNNLHMTVIISFQHFTKVKN